MGEKGMVLTLAIWSDSASDMTWLDSCLANKSQYDCAKHWRPTSSQVFAEAPPGAWRGPVDAYTDFATSFASKTVDLSFPEIPSDWRSQGPFECSKSGTTWDCSGVDYEFVVGEITVSSSLPPERILGPLPERERLQDAGSERWYVRILKTLGWSAVAIIAIVACIGGIVFMSHKSADESGSSGDENQWPYNKRQK